MKSGNAAARVLRRNVFAAMAEAPNLVNVSTLGNRVSAKQSLGQQGCAYR